MKRKQNTFTVNEVTAVTGGGLSDPLPTKGQPPGQPSSASPSAGNSAPKVLAASLPMVEPWPDSVNGAEVLNAVANRVARYLALPPGGQDVLALWIVHAHAFEAFSHTPRLNFCAPEKGCGKTTALDVVASMVPRPVQMENTTAAVIFRLVDNGKPTLLLDELDIYLKKDALLRGLLNSGHKRGALAFRCAGGNNVVRSFNAFAPAALAGIGALPGTLHDRSVVVRLLRAKPGEVTARFDSRCLATETELCRKLARWTADNFARLESCDPRLPFTAYNRVADNWRPLFAVAEVAGEDWPQRAAAAFTQFTSWANQDAQGIGVMLLGDIASVFAAAGADKLPSAQLTAALADFEGRPWPEFGPGRKGISPNQLAVQLGKFGIAPQKWRNGNGTERGYVRADFEQVFERFLPEGGVAKRHNATTVVNKGDSGPAQSPQQGELWQLQTNALARSHEACGGVANPKADRETDTGSGLQICSSQKPLSMPKPIRLEKQQGLQDTHEQMIELETKNKVVLTPAQARATYVNTGLFRNGKPLFRIPTRKVLTPKTAFRDKKLCDGPTFTLWLACCFGCLFCYVESLLRRHAGIQRLLKESGLQFHEVAVEKEDPLPVLRRQLLTRKGNPRYNDPTDHRVIFASPLVDVAANGFAANQIVEASRLILEHTHWEIRLLSKSALLKTVAVQLDSFKDRVLYGFSTGTLDDRLAASFELRTSSPSARLSALHWLQDNGYRTFGMICPSLPQEDYDGFARSMAEAIRADRCEHVWAEVLNVRGESLRRTSEGLRRGGFAKEAAMLERVSKYPKEWEAYARNTFLAHARVFPPDKLRFLQYVGKGQLEWWQQHQVKGAVLLGSASRGESKTVTEAEHS